MPSLNFTFEEEVMSLCTKIDFIIVVVFAAVTAVSVHRSLCHLLPFHLFYTLGL